MTQEAFVESQVAPSESVPESPSEKMVQMPQSQFDHIVKTAKAETSRKEQARFEAERAQLLNNTAPSSTSPPQVPEEYIRQIVADETTKRAQQYEQNYQYQQGMQLVNDFFGKLQAAEKDHEGLGQKMATLPFDKMPEIVHLANELPQTAEIMLALHDSPAKIATLQNLARLSPDLARIEMRKLADSIDLNKKAAETRQANEPLSQIKPTSIGLDNGIARTVSDFRKVFRR